MSSLPNTWCETTVAEIVAAYDNLDPASQPDRVFQYVDIGSIDNTKQKISHPKNFLGKNAPSRARRVVKAGDTLFSTVRTYLKNIALVPPELDNEITSTGIAVLRPNGVVEPDYLFAVARSDTFIAIVSKAQDGTMYPAVSDADVLSGPIPLPPKAEQRRIVAKIDSLSAKSMRARDRLEHIPKLVQKYKQAVLDSCFLNFVYKKSLIDFVEEERGIPYGIIQTGIPTTNGVPTVRCGDIRDYGVNKTTLKLVDPDIESQYQRTRLRGGEILITIRGSIGNTCVAPNDLSGCNISREVAMIPLRKGQLPQFFSYYLTSAKAHSYILGNVKGVAQQGINLADLRGVPVPMVDAAVQGETVRRIESAFAWIDRLATEATSARALIDRVDQAVLAKAFRGELVPQNPADEPASVLLERIRAERAGAPAPKRRGRPRVPALP